MSARPAGAFVIKDGTVRWRPAVDVNRLFATIGAVAIANLFGATNWFTQGVAAAVATVVTLPYGVLVGVLLYLDLRARTERLSLEALRRTCRRRPPDPIAARGNEFAPYGFPRPGGRVTARVRLWP